MDLYDSTEDDRWYACQNGKMGAYENPPNGCPNCSRHRVMVGADKKHRCEKCAWCIEDNERDYAFLQYLG